MNLINPNDANIGDIDDYFTLGLGIFISFNSDCANGRKKYKNKITDQCKEIKQLYTKIKVLTKFTQIKKKRKYVKNVKKQKWILSETPHFDKNIQRLPKKRCTKENVAKIRGKQKKYCRNLIITSYLVINNEFYGYPICFRCFKNKRKKTIPKKEHCTQLQKENINLEKEDKTVKEIGSFAKGKKQVIGNDVVYFEEKCKKKYIHGERNVKRKENYFSIFNEILNKKIKEIFEKNIYLIKKRIKFPIPIAGINPNSYVFFLIQNRLNRKVVYVSYCKLLSKNEILRQGIQVRKVYHVKRKGKINKIIKNALDNKFYFQYGNSIEKKKKKIHNYKKSDLYYDLIKYYWGRKEKRMQIHKKLKNGKIQEKKEGITYKITEEQDKIITSFLKIKSEEANNSSNVIYNASNLGELWNNEERSEKFKQCVILESCSKKTNDFFYKNLIRYYYIEQYIFSLKYKLLEIGKKERGTEIIINLENKEKEKRGVLLNHSSSKYLVNTVPKSTYSFFEKRKRILCRNKCRNFCNNLYFCKRIVDLHKKWKKKKKEKMKGYLIFSFLNFNKKIIYYNENKSDISTFYENDFERFYTTSSENVVNPIYCSKSRSDWFFNSFDFVENVRNESLESSIFKKKKKSTNRKTYFSYYKKNGVSLANKKKSIVDDIIEKEKKGKMNINKKKLNDVFENVSKHINRISKNIEIQNNYRFDDYPFDFLSKKKFEYISALMPTINEIKTLNTILNTPLIKINEYEKNCIWKFRFQLLNRKETLGKFLKCVNWDNEDEKEEATILISKWSKPDLENCLELFDSHLKYSLIRNYIIDIIKNAPKKDIKLFLFQLTQSIRFINIKNEDNVYVKTLIERCVRSKKLSIHFHWFLQSETKNKTKGDYYLQVHKLFITNLINSNSKKKKKILEILKNQNRFRNQLLFLTKIAKNKSDRIQTKTKKLRQLLFLYKTNYGYLHVKQFIKNNIFVNDKREFYFDTYQKEKVSDISTETKENDFIIINNVMPYKKKLMMSKNDYISDILEKGIQKEENKEDGNHNFERCNTFFKMDSELEEESSNIRTEIRKDIGTDVEMNTETGFESEVRAISKIDNKIDNFVHNKTYVENKACHITCDAEISKEEVESIQKKAITNDKSNNKKYNISNSVYFLTDELNLNYNLKDDYFFFEHKKDNRQRLASDISNEMNSVTTYIDDSKIMKREKHKDISFFYNFLQFNENVDIFSNSFHNDRDDYNIIENLEDSIYLFNKHKIKKIEIPLCLPIDPEIELLTFLPEQSYVVRSTLYPIVVACLVRKKKKILYENCPNLIINKHCFVKKNKPLQGECSMFNSYPNSTFLNILQKSVDNTEELKYWHNSMKIENGILFCKNKKIQRVEKINEEEKKKGFLNTLEKGKNYERLYDLSIKKYIYKAGDDLRQDHLVLQLIYIIDSIWKKYELDLRLTFYKVLALSTDDGFIEFVENAESISSIKKNYKGEIRQYFMEEEKGEEKKEEEKKEEKEEEEKEKSKNIISNNVQNISGNNENIYERANEGVKENTNVYCNLGYNLDSLNEKIYEKYQNFISSCAGYCVITYILGIGDRHLDNLMVTKSGHFFHIDFGYIFGEDPKPFSPPMKLCKEMIDTMGGANSKGYEEFLKKCCLGYKYLRKHAKLIISILNVMRESELKDMKTSSELCILKVQEKFRLDLNDEAAEIYFLSVINASVKTLFPIVVDKLHEWAVNWK